MKKALIAVSALLALTACTPRQIAAWRRAQDVPAIPSAQAWEPAPAEQIVTAPSGTFTWSGDCTNLSVTAGGYPAGTVFYVQANGAPPYHLTDGETYAIPYPVSSYGIYIARDGDVYVDMHADC